MYAALLVVTCALFALVSWRDLKTGVLLFLAALPCYLLRFEVGIPSTLLELLFCILFVVFLVKRRDLVRAWIAERRSWQAWYVPLALLFLAAGMGVAVSPVMLSALGLLKAYVVEPILLFLIVRDLFTGEEDRAKLLRALALGGAFAAVVGIAQYAFDAGIPAPWDIERRVTGPFPYPNALGLYLAPLIVVAAFGAWRDAKWRAGWIACLILSCVGIFLSQTEAAWASIPPVLFLAAMRSWEVKPGRFKPGRFNLGGLTSQLFVLAIVAILLVALIPAVRGPVVEKLTLQDASGQVRLAQWQETWAFLRDGHWLLGAGLAGYPIAIAPYHIHTQYEIFQDPHNVVLNIWVEMGLLGLMGTALLAWQVLRAPKRDWVALAAAFALLQMLIHGLVDVPFFKNDLAMMAFALMALVAIRRDEVKPRHA